LKINILFFSATQTCDVFCTVHVVSNETRDHCMLPSVVRWTG